MQFLEVCVIANQLEKTNRLLAMQAGYVPPPPPERGFLYGMAVGMAGACTVLMVGWVAWGILIG